MLGGPNRNFSLSKNKSTAPDLSTTLKVVKHTLKMMEIDAAVIFLFCGTLGSWAHAPKLASAINRNGGLAGMKMVHLC